MSQVHHRFDQANNLIAGTTLPDLLDCNLSVSTSQHGCTAVTDDAELRERK